MTAYQQDHFSRLFERLFALVGLLYMIGALTGFFMDLSRTEMGSQRVTTEGNQANQMFSGLIYLISGIMIFVNFGTFLKLCSKNKVVLFLVLLALLSAIWSIAPGASFRRSVALVGTTLFAIYLAMRFSPEELLRLLAWALGLTAIASLVLVFVAPSYGIHGAGPHQGAWHGVFGHKNAFGPKMVLGVVVFVVALSIPGFSRLVAWGGLLLCAALAIMSTSRTAWVTLAAMLILIWPVQALRESRTSLTLRFAAVLIVFGAGGLLLLITFFQVGLEALGRDPTLSSRTDIWALAWEFGMQRPWLGFGYRVFWTDDNAGRIFSLLWGGSFGQSHNSYVDLWLDIGFVGLGVYSVTLVICLHRVWTRLTTTRDALGLWFALSLAFILIAGIPGGAILEHESIEWVIYVSTMFYLTVPQHARQSLPATARLAVPRSTASS